MENRQYETPYGKMVLSRGSDERNRTLQAWNSADLYLLEKMGECELAEGSSILVVNDAFGALTVPLARKFRVSCWTDSSCAEKHIRANLRDNGVDEKEILFLSPENSFPGAVDLVLLKNPKSLRFLEYILQGLSSELRDGTKVLAGDMARNIHSSTVALLETYLVGAKTSRAWKKARLMEGRTAGQVTGSTTFPVEYRPVGMASTVLNYPNLFAFGRLDPGSAFMIENMPEPASVPERIIDLACGDGILALKAAEKWPGASILCVDESRLAVRSARESFKRNGLAEKAAFAVADILEGVETEKADLVLCNPPFHDNHSLSTTSALKMFSQSREVLRVGGELFIIANRHLGYEKSLSRLFSKVSVWRNNRKFAIIRAVK